MACPNELDKTLWREAFELETRVAQIIRQQEINGWAFDMPKALALQDHIRELIQQVDDEILPQIPFRQISYDRPDVGSPFKKNGDLSERVKNYFKEDEPPVFGPFTKVSWEQINLGSESQVKDYLLSVGWQPTEWNTNDDGERTSPKLSEDSFGSIKDGLGKLIVDRMTYKHRLGLVEGLIKNVRPDGRIEARANTIGTPTFRFTHKIVVNIPKAAQHVFLGKQFRELFCVREGRKQVGCDAKGLENRMLAHYMNNPDLTKIILTGDFHTTVWDTIKTYVHTRDNTKNVEYALFYGAGDAKLGRMADFKPKGWSDSVTGMAIRSSIMAGLPALGKLTEGVQKAARRGFLYGLDKRKLWCRSPHSALNTLLQSSGAIVMKRALVLMTDRLNEEQLDSLQIGHFHDEVVLDVREDQAERAAEIAAWSIAEAGRYYKLNCPLEGDWKVGMSWAETH